jgi:hypothetical protein
LKFLKMQEHITAQKNEKNWTRNNCWLFRVIVIAQTSAVFFHGKAPLSLSMWNVTILCWDFSFLISFGFSLWITWKICWCPLYYMIHNIYLWLFVSPSGIWALISLEVSSLRQGICDYWQNCKYSSLCWWVCNYWCV